MAGPLGATTTGGRESTSYVLISLSCGAQVRPFRFGAAGLASPPEVSCGLALTAAVPRDAGAGGARGAGRPSSRVRTSLGESWRRTRTARHVAFLGDRPHGVPAELAPENLLASRINCAKDDPGTTRISVLVNLWDRKPVGVSRAAPYRGSTVPIDVNFAQPVAPPIEVVQPDDHLLAEHRDGDTLPIPITRWIHSLAGGIPGHALELRSSQ